MPIRSVREIEAARRAREASTVHTAVAEGGETPKGGSGGGSGPSQPKADAAAAEHDKLGNSPLKSKRKRGHARKAKNRKWLPTGPNGFAAPPPEHRFKDGNCGGGRKAKVRPSTDDLYRKHLELKRKAKIGGEECTMEQRDLLIATTIRDALAGERASRKHTLDQMPRLYPSLPDKISAISPSEINAADALSLAEFREELIAEFRASASTADKEEKGDD